MTEKITSSLPSSHITEFVGEPKNVPEFELSRINLSLGFLAEHGQFPQDSVYESLRDEAYKATHDPLTGLLNRDGLARKFDELTKHAESNPNVRYAYILLDLDGFKEINDSLGHDAGDGLLEGVAKRWTREGDVLARIGGDEFVMIANTTNTGNNLRHAKSEEEAAEGAVRRLKEQALKAGEECELKFKGVSAGVALWVPGRTLDELKKEADEKMYEDKAARKAAR